jgi:hypothetical protein
VGLCPWRFRCIFTSGGRNFPPFSKTIPLPSFCLLMFSFGIGNFHDRLKVWSVGSVVFEGVRLDVDYLVDATDG